MIKNVETSDAYICKYCNKEYKREQSLTTHLPKCKSKYETPRYLERLEESNSVYFRIGFYSYLSFYENGFRTKKTLAQFLNSREYSGFIRFGRYCLTMNTIHLEKFVNYIIKKSYLKLKDWVNPNIYTEYMYDLVMTEVPGDALERAIEYSIEWSNENNIDSNDIIRCNKTTTVCYFIINGYISPWVLFNCKSGILFLDELDKNHMEIIWSFVNPTLWEIKMDKSKSQVKYIMKTLTELGW